MEIVLNLKSLKQKSLTPNQVVLLKLLYDKNFEDIKEIFGIKEAIAIRDSLIGSKYILNPEGSLVKFTETLISNKNIEKLLGIRSDNINFLEFYNHYPIRVGSRILRASGADTQVAKKHEKKYLLKVKTLKQHQTAIKAMEAFVAFQKRSNKLQYLPNMETVLNNSMWENWEVFIQSEGKEEQEWNTQTI